jgi:hypothetical protein
MWNFQDLVWTSDGSRVGAVSVFFLVFLGSFLVAFFSDRLAIYARVISYAHRDWITTEAQRVRICEGRRSPLMIALKHRWGIQSEQPCDFLLENRSRRTESNVGAKKGKPRDFTTNMYKKSKSQYVQQLYN